MNNHLGVIPAKAGIHFYQGLMDPRFPFGDLVRVGDRPFELCNYLREVIDSLIR